MKEITADVKDAKRNQEPCSVLSYTIETKLLSIKRLFYLIKRKLKFQMKGGWEVEHCCAKI